MTYTHEEAMEDLDAVAIALYEADDHRHHNVFPGWAVEDDETRERYRERARHALEPVETTEAHQPITVHCAVGLGPIPDGAAIREAMRVAPDDATLAKVTPGGSLSGALGMDNFAITWVEQR